MGERLHRTGDPLSRETIVEREAQLDSSGVGSADQPGEVLILGAGFSRAISRHLPLANGLGAEAFERARKSAPGLFDEAIRVTDAYPFEVWLSLLAEDQPHLEEGANRMNAARFAKLSDAIVAVLGEAQEQALADEAPVWLYELLSVLHYRRCSVISLNYDTLIEVGINSMHLGSRRNGTPWPLPIDDSIGAFAYIPSQGTTVDDVLRGQPPVSQLAARASELDQTLRLLKLHGSLGWWWAPDDQSGATLAREQTSSTFGNPVVMSNEERSLALPGREPFIVPPLAGKSRFFRNPLTRQLWRDAYRVLSNATRIALVGYSLPQTDHVMAGMLASALRASNADVEIVNPDGDDVAARVVALGGPSRDSEQMTYFDSEACVEDYARALCDRSAAGLVGPISRLTPIYRSQDPDPAGVAWSYRGQRVNHRVVSLERRVDGELIVDTEEGIDFSVDPSDTRPTTRELISSLEGVTRLVARAPNGREATIVAFETPNFENRNARHVLYLIPAGQLVG